MSKGAARKISAVEKMDEDKEEDEDELDSNWTSKKKAVKEIGEENYRPRVYKWRLERKK